MYISTWQCGGAPWQVVFPFRMLDKILALRPGEMLWMQQADHSTCSHECVPFLLSSLSPKRGWQDILAPPGFSTTGCIKCPGFPGFTTGHRGSAPWPAQCLTLPCTPQDGTSPRELQGPLGTWVLCPMCAGRPAPDTRTGCAGPLLALSDLAHGQSR